MIAFMNKHIGAGCKHPTLQKSNNHLKLLTSISSCSTTVES